MYNAIEIVIEQQKELIFQYDRIELNKNEINLLRRALVAVFVQKLPNNADTTLKLLSKMSDRDETIKQTKLYSYYKTVEDSIH